METSQFIDQLAAGEAAQAKAKTKNK